MMLARRKMAAGELAEAIGITPANLSILKNGKARAIRITTLEAVCRALDCQPGDILEYVPGNNGGDVPDGSAGDVPDGNG